MLDCARLARQHIVMQREIALKDGQTTLMRRRRIGHTVQFDLADGAQPA
jgi:hypothetical protein